jgi:hypothetical protein
VALRLTGPPFPNFKAAGKARIIWKMGVYYKLTKKTPVGLWTIPIGHINREEVLAFSATRNNYPPVTPIGPKSIQSCKVNQSSHSSILHGRPVAGKTIFATPLILAASVAFRFAAGCGDRAMQRADDYAGD